MVHKLLQDAVKNNANVIAATCPMCNVNVEVYQSQVNREFGTDFSIPVMYFTQLMGMALGIDPGRIGVRASMLSLAQSTE